MKRLFRKDLSTLRPGLSARVFKYLASVLEGRLRIREGTVVRTAETSEPAMGYVKYSPPLMYWCVCSDLVLQQGCQASLEEDP